MIQALRINKRFALFVIGLIYFYFIMITMNSWYKIPLAVRLRKESRLLTFNGNIDNTVTARLENDKHQTQWSQRSPLLPLKQNLTKVRKSKSKIGLNNIVSDDNTSSTLVGRLLKINNYTKQEEAIVMQLCDKYPPDLGPIQVNKTELKLDYVERKFPEVHLGGRYFPPNCIARHKVAIIVPYRDREQHLAIFLNHMHPFLIKQQIEYGIFIIEQAGIQEFNRAKLMNVGFVEAQRLKAGWQCFIFHDIDLLPLDTRNMYSCPKQPRHMSASIDKLDFKLPYDEIFGGVSALTLEQFIKVNGFSNKYWGWGGEDDDMFYRLEQRNYHIGRYKMSIARYAMVDHKKSHPNKQRLELLSKTNKTYQMDGLSNLQYELVKVTQHHLYTHVLVNIDDKTEMSWWMKFINMLW